MTEQSEALRLLTKYFGAVPHSQTIGMDLVDTGRGYGVQRVRYKPDLVGDPQSGVMHGGVITSLIDNCGGLAVICALESPEFIATLDLRIDYLKRATPFKDVYARSECYRLTRQIAFVRTIAYHDSADDPLATSLSTYMRTGAAMPAGGKKVQRSKEDQ